MKNTLKLFLAVLFAGAAFLSCKTYKVIRQSTDEFYSTKPVIDAFGNYNVYIHDPSGVYRVGQPSISNKGIQGEVVPVKDSAAIAALAKPGGGKKGKAHRFDLNFYTDKKVNDNQTAALGEEVPAKDVVLKREDIKEVAIKAVDKKKSYARAGSFILGLLVLVALVIVLVFAIGLGSAASGAASSNSSGGSGSNSGSGTSSSGCYIATMAYGSYDAPEVLVLRRFRDQKLARSVFGRWFIRVYYRYSPGLVELLKGHERANAAIRRILDKFVNYLERK